MEGKLTLMRSRIGGGAVRELKGLESESQREMGLEEEEVWEEGAGVLGRTVEEDVRVSRGETRSVDGVRGGERTLRPAQRGPRDRESPRRDALGWWSW